MDNETREKLSNLRQRLTIDPYNLEEECVGQPSLYAEVGELATEARSAAKKAKDALDFTRADLSFKIRKEPGKYGVEKVTEASIESAIIIQKEYQQAAAVVIETQKLSDAFGVLQDSVAQRKSMLKDLVSLFIYNYYMSKAEMGGERRQVNEVEVEVTKEAILNRRAEIAAARGGGVAGSDDVEVEVED